jgi:hypothetical protein
VARRAGYWPRSIRHRSAAPPGAGYSQEQIDSLREQIMKDPTKLQKMLEEMGKGVPKVPDIPMPPMELPPGEPMPDEPVEEP